MSKFHIIFASLVALSVAPSAAFAHAELIKSDPAKDATLGASAKEISLTFDEAVKPATCKLSMSDGMNMAVLGKPRADGTTLHVPIEKPLMAGTYKLDCRVVGPDSHAVNSTLSFTVSTTAPK